MVNAARKKIDVRDRLLLKSVGLESGERRIVLKSEVVLAKEERDAELGVDECSLGSFGGTVVGTDFDMVGAVRKLGSVPAS